MALATQCPHCNTIFRVASDQLKLRGGIVRCGSCQEVFDGNAALVDPAAIPPAALAMSTAPIALLRVAASDAAAEADPADLAQPASPQAESESEPELQPETTPDAEGDPHQALAESAGEPSADQQLRSFALPKVASAGGAERQVDAEPDPIEPESVAPEMGEPDFVKRGRRRQQRAKTAPILMATASLLLALLLLAQGATLFRSALAAHLPALKPALEGWCAAIGCRVGLPAQIDALSIDAGQLQNAGENTFALSTLVRNQSNVVQAWPCIELSITDASDRPLVRRVFQPSEYLQPALRQHLDLGFPARSEQTVQLHFVLARASASGYHIAVFYP
jgi:predicted Zn finger-like uncharacterized protein